jgi:hypothetical protein
MLFRFLIYKSVLFNRSYSLSLNVGVGLVINLKNYQW